MCRFFFPPDFSTVLSRNPTSAVLSAMAPRAAPFLPHLAPERRLDPAHGLVHGGPCLAPEARRQLRLGRLALPCLEGGEAGREGGGRKARKSVCETEGGREGADKSRGGQEGGGLQGRRKPRPGTKRPARREAQTCSRLAAAWACTMRSSRSRSNRGVWEWPRNAPLTRRDITQIQLK